MKIVAIFLLLLTASAYAQNPSHGPVGPQATTPALGTSDKIALQTEETAKSAAAKAYQDAQQMELTILGEFTKAHPGFHVNPQTFVVEADEAKVANVDTKAAPSQPAAKYPRPVETPKK
jgi:ABC-type glycerol-3-phosphate transport system substrate-binding protein